MKRVVQVLGWSVLLLVLAGCGVNEPSTGPQPAGRDEGKPPHGGTLYAEPEHKIHLELVLDKEKKKATVYLLDEKVKNPVRTKADKLILTLKDVTPPKQFELKPEPHEKETAGETSRFSLEDERFGSDVDTDKVTMSAEVGGKQYEFEPDKDE